MLHRVFLPPILVLHREKSGAILENSATLDGAGGLIIDSVALRTTRWLS